MKGMGTGMGTGEADDARGGGVAWCGVVWRGVAAASRRRARRKIFLSCPDARDNANIEHRTSNAHNIEPKKGQERKQRHSGPFYRSQNGPHSLA